MYLWCCKLFFELQCFFYNVSSNHMGIIFIKVGMSCIFFIAEGAEDNITFFQHHTKAENTITLFFNHTQNLWDDQKNSKMMPLLELILSQFSSSIGSVFPWFVGNNCSHILLSTLIALLHENCTSKISILRINNSTKNNNVRGDSFSMLHNVGFMTGWFFSFLTT